MASTAQAAESIRSPSLPVLSMSGGSGASRAGVRSSDQVSVVEHGKSDVTFVITHAPTESTVDQYVKDLQKYDVKYVVRVCDPTYPKEKLAAVGIEVYDWAFKDGDAPPAAVVKQWTTLLQEMMAHGATAGHKPTVAVHCVAGLGRAPVLVAIGLIEQGVESFDAIQYVRERRRGAFNAKQIRFLEEYKPQPRTGTLRKKLLGMFGLSRSGSPAASPSASASTSAVAVSAAAVATS